MDAESATRGAAGPNPIAQPMDVIDGLFAQHMAGAADHSKACAFDGAKLLVAGIDTSQVRRASRRRAMLCLAADRELPASPCPAAACAAQGGAQEQKRRSAL